MKTCTRCGVTKPLTRFSLRRAGESKRRSACLDCSGSDRRRWRAANPEKANAASRRWYRMKKYGLSEDDVAAMLDAQDDRCGICRDDIREKPYIDHCHATNTVRELLCCNCNVAIGMLQDDPARATAAARYLVRHGR